MLQSGIKAPMAVRIYGDSLEGLGEGVAGRGRTPEEAPLRQRRNRQPRHRDGQAVLRVRGGPRGSGPLRHDDDDGQPDRLRRTGRPGRDDDRRRPRTLSDPDPLPARRPRTPRRTAPSAGGHPHRRRRALGATGPGRHHVGTRCHQQRGRPTGGPRRLLARPAVRATWRPSKR